MEIPLFLYSNSKDFINFPKNKYFPERSLIVANNIYIILVIFIWYNIERRKQDEKNNRINIDICIYIFANGLL